jgi:hypothetical protein
VRVRLLAAVAIQDILASVSDKVLRKAAALRDFSRAMALVDKMQRLISAAEAFLPDDML